MNCVDINSYHLPVYNWIVTSWLGNNLISYCHVYVCQGVTKRCRLSLLTNSALVIRVLMRGQWGVAGSQPQPMSTAVHITWHGAQINFGNLPTYLTYGVCAFNYVLFLSERFRFYFYIWCLPQVSLRKMTNLVLMRRGNKKTRIAHFLHGII